MQKLTHLFLYLSQFIHNCHTLDWATSWVPSELVIEGYQPFVRRLIGVPHIVLYIQDINQPFTFYISGLPSCTCKTKQIQAI